MDSFLDLERREATLNGERAGDVMRGLGGTLTDASADWAYWDDTYAFMKDHNQAYIDANFKIVVLKLDLIFFVDTQGKLFYSRPVARTPGVSPPSAESTMAALRLSDPAERIKIADGLSGFLIVDGRPTVVALRPVLPTSQKGAPRGWLVFVKYLDGEDVKSLSDRTHLNVELYELTRSDLPKDVANIREALSSASPNQTRLLPDSRIAAYSVVRDVYGAPALIIRVPQPRPIFEQGQLAVRYLLTVVIVAGILFGALLLAILDRSTLARLDNLLGQVRGIRTTGLEAASVSLPGRDELCELASGINEMLEKLRQNSHQLADSNAELQTLVAKLNASRQVLENALDGVAVLTPDGGIAEANAAFAEIAGYPPESLITMSWRDLIVAEEWDKFAEWSSNLVLGEPIEQDFRLARPSGEDVYCRVALLMHQDSPHSATGTHIFLKDITQARQVEVEHLRRIRAEQANDAKTEFLSRTSHELRTPMNAIIGFSQILELTLKSDKERELIRHVISASEHLLALINGVLDVSRIESKTFSISMEPVHVATLIQEAVDLVQPNAASRDITVTITRLDRDAWVRADNQRLRQALLNLLSNAIKYNRAGGSMEIGATLQDGFVRVAVGDTGGGIPADLRSRLFLPFDRLGAETTGVPGTGLGLAITKSLVECMEGSISVDDRPGGGSVFALEFAAIPAPEFQNKATSESRSLGGGEDATVLYIEDNFSNTNLMTEIANLLGFRLITCAQGRLGCEEAAALKPDLILLDLDLPDITGEEALRLLRVNGDTRPIPVVVVSADASQGRIARLMRLGASGYLTKPFNIRDIQRVVFLDPPTNPL